MFIDYFGYWVCIGIVAVCFILLIYIKRKAFSIYKQYGKIPSRSRMIGYDVATYLLRENGINNVSVETAANATKRSLILSEEVYYGNFLSSLVLAASEAIYFIKNNVSSYKLARIRMHIIKLLVIFGLIFVFFGFFYDFFVKENGTHFIYLCISIIGTIMFAGSMLFILAKLPKERALGEQAIRTLVARNVLTNEEVAYAEELLNGIVYDYFLYYFLARHTLFQAAIFGAYIYKRRSERRDRRR